MKAVVFHGIGEISLDEVRQPELRQPADAVVRLVRARAVRPSDAITQREPLTSAIDVAP